MKLLNFRIYFVLLIVICVMARFGSARLIYRKTRKLIVHTSNIVTAPLIVECPFGQLRDARNKCRKVILHSFFFVCVLTC